jgi:hypothetical protein
VATLNFDESIVLILFAQAAGTSPSHAAIVQFDADLQDTFGSRLHQIMTEEGLAIDVHSRSLVLGCRPNVPGNTPATQIRNACRYVLKAQQFLSAPLLASRSPTETRTLAKSSESSSSRKKTERSPRSPRRKTSGRRSTKDPRS